MHTYSNLAKVCKNIESSTKNIFYNPIKNSEGGTKAFQSIGAFSWCAESFQSMFFVCITIIIWRY